MEEQDALQKDLKKLESVIKSIHDEYIKDYLYFNADEIEKIEYSFRNFEKRFVKFIKNLNK